MHPIWVIRASRTAFALLPNRVLTSNVCHKRLPSTVIFHHLLRPLLSTLIPSICTPSSTPSRRALPTQLNYPSCGIFFRPPCYSSRFSLHRSFLSDFFSPGTGWPLQPSHTLKSTFPRLFGLLLATQRCSDEYTSKIPLPSFCLGSILSFHAGLIQSTSAVEGGVLAASHELTPHRANCLTLFVPHPSSASPGHSCFCNALPHAWLRQDVMHDLSCRHLSSSHSASCTLLNPLNTLFNLLR
jgi:hypothetical protein